MGELTAQVRISKFSNCKTWYENARVCGISQLVRLVTPGTGDCAAVTFNRPKSWSGGINYEINGEVYRGALDLVPVLLRYFFHPRHRHPPARRAAFGRGPGLRALGILEQVLFRYPLRERRR